MVDPLSYPENSQEQDGSGCVMLGMAGTTLGICCAVELAALFGTGSIALGTEFKQWSWIILGTVLLGFAIAGFLLVQSR